MREDWDMNFEAIGFKNSEISEKEREKLRMHDLRSYYKQIHVCKICKRKYGSDINEKLKLCPDCDVKLKGKPEEKKKLSLASETKHLNKGDTTK